MFDIEEFTDIGSANEHIKKILAELDVPNAIEFTIVHSLSLTECEENGGEWNAIGEILYNSLLDLDAQQGIMYYYEKDDLWDCIEGEPPDEIPIHKPVNKDKTFIHAGEGVVVLYNKFAVCEDQYPIIVVKKSFYDSYSKRLIEMLKYQTQGSDYSSKISPAVYVQLIYA